MHEQNCKMSLVFVSPRCGHTGEIWKLLLQTLPRWKLENTPPPEEKKQHATECRKKDDRDKERKSTKSEKSQVPEKVEREKEKKEKEKEKDKGLLTFCNFDRYTLYMLINIWHLKHLLKRPNYVTEKISHHH